MKKITIYLLLCVASIFLFTNCGTTNSKKTYNVIISASPDSGGTVSPQSGIYDEGTVLNIKAMPNSGWKFDHWSGDYQGTNSTATVTVTKMMNIVANFSRKGNGAFAGGDGSETNPYKVSTIKQLQKANLFSSAHFIQINDIDASSTKMWNDGKGFIPIGVTKVGFTGSYNGQGYKISNLYINRPTGRPIGLFGKIGKDAVVKNVHLVDADITGDINVGGLTGVLNGGLITLVSVSGTIKAGIHSGGIAGMIRRGTISKSYNIATIVGIKTSDQKGGECGGISGWATEQAKIIDTYNGGNIKKCHWNAAGILAGISGKTLQSFTIKNTYNFGMVHSSGAPNKNGGIIGRIPKGLNITLKNNYYDGQTTGSMVKSNIVKNGAFPTSKMMQKATFVGFDFGGTWAIDEGSSYPYLQSNKQNPLPGTK